tara:strand:- start:73 stop:381 length:309 start_codon:yes stop_codon:yes gene_type:complete
MEKREFFYCRFYDDNISHTVLDREFNFINISLYSLVVLVTGIIMTILVESRSYYLLRKKIDNNEPIELNEYKVLRGDELVLRLLGLFIGVFVGQCWIFLQRL